MCWCAFVRACVRACIFVCFYSTAKPYNSASNGIFRLMNVASVIRSQCLLENITIGARCKTQKFKFKANRSENQTIIESDHVKIALK